MASRKFHFKGFTMIEGDMKLKVSLSRFEKQFQKAQDTLDGAVMESMEPFMPKQSGVFIDVTKGMSAAMAGSGIVVAAAPPMGRFLYEGKTMVDEKTGSPWARKGAKKVLVSQYKGKTLARENLEFDTNTNPDAQPHWFDPAKKKDGEMWVEKVKEIAGGGDG